MNETGRTVHWIAADGALHEVDLTPGEILQLETGHSLAFAGEVRRYPPEDARKRLEAELAEANESLGELVSKHPHLKSAPKHIPGSSD